MSKFMYNLRLFIILLIISNYSSSQEIIVTIDTLNIVYTDNRIIIPYKFKNLTDKEVIFLDKKEFISDTWCYKISDTNNFYEKDTTRVIEDFLTLGPGEEAERKALIYLYWPCRSAPGGSLYAAYSSNITKEDNYYNYTSGEGLQLKMQIVAWTGTITSASFLLFDK